MLTFATALIGLTTLARSQEDVSKTSVVLQQTYAPMAAADEFHGSLYPNMCSVRPGDAEDAVAITHHAEILGVRKLAILHSADTASLAALESAERTSMDGVPPFHQRVYALVGQIPLDETSAARAAGQALGHNPFAPVVPCHRILSGPNSMGRACLTETGGTATLRSVDTP